MFEFVRNGGYRFGVLVAQGGFVVMLVVIDAANGDVFRVEVKC